MMDNFRVAVKSFIVKDGKILLLKRRSNDVHRPGEWDIPGGRLEVGEDPYIGLKRETKEESNLDVDILLPFDVHHFVRQDGQEITMIIFLCKLLSSDIILSKEHTEYKWVSVDCKKEDFPDRFHQTLDNFVKYKLDAKEL